jgi:hypothetical protein
LKRYALSFVRTSCIEKEIGGGGNEDDGEEEPVGNPNKYEFRNLWKV